MLAQPRQRLHRRRRERLLDQLDVVRVEPIERQPRDRLRPRAVRIQADARAGARLAQRRDARDVDGEPLRADLQLQRRETRRDRLPAGVGYRGRRDRARVDDRVDGDARRRRAATTLVELGRE